MNSTQLVIQQTNVKILHLLLYTHINVIEFDIRVLCSYENVELWQEQIYV